MRGDLAQSDLVYSSEGSVTLLRQLNKLMVSGGKLITLKGANNVGGIHENVNTGAVG